MSPLLYFQGKGLSVDAASLILRRCQRQDLAAIEELSLAHNCLTTTPSFMPATLVYLDLSFNAIDALPDLRDLACLTKLNISNNSLSSLLALSFNTRLEALSLSSNR